MLHGLDYAARKRLHKMTQPNREQLEPHFFRRKLRCVLKARIAIVQVEKATGCTASAGIGPNMLVARLATKKAKPNGAFRIRAAEAQGAIAALPLADLPGVGWCACQMPCIVKVRWPVQHLLCQACQDLLFCRRLPVSKADVD